MAIATQLTIQLHNRPGALAELCTELAKVAVNIHAIHGSEARPLGAVRLLVSNLPAARRVLEQLGLSYLEEKVLTALVPDRPGALGRVTRKLAAAGVNIDYIYGSIGRGTKRALLVLGVADAESNAKLLR
jgi:hypothetical protein